MNHSPIQFIDNSPGITDVPGFKAAGIAADIRENGQERRDLALIFSETPCTAAGVFTTNDVKAAPVIHCASILQGNSTFHGIIANSGNANACTGKAGHEDVIRTASRAAELLGVPANSLFVCSTGRIGRRLPMTKVLSGLEKVVTALGQTPQHGVDAAWAILTSDTRPKSFTAQFTWEGQTVTLAGIAKGAGMIEPNMATMLAFIATDAKVEPSLLRQCLVRANQSSFNRITVDGDMSTNDTVLVLANGVSGVEITEKEPALLELFQTGLNRIALELAKKIVGDGEKVTKFVTVRIQGAKTEEAAEKIARAIGNSLLVKSSWYGNDPNWGRLMDAAGYARTGLIEEKVDLYYNDCPVLLQGTPQDERLSDWKTIVRERAFTITMNLNLGTASYELLAADLSEAYVDFNKSE